MVPKFIPVALEAISPTIDLTDAINALSGSTEHSYSVFRRWDEDTFTVKINGEMMSEEQARPIILARHAVYDRASERLLAALRSGEVSSYVMRASDHTFWRIPASYFNRQKMRQIAYATLVEWYPESGEHPSMYGQAIIVSERQFQAWLSGQARANEPLEVAGPASVLPSDLLPEVDHDHLLAVKAKPLPDSALRKWVRLQNEKGASLNAIIDGSRSAFPSHSVPPRRRVEEMDRSVRRDLALPARRRGAPKRI